MNDEGWENSREFRFEQPPDVVTLRRLHWGRVPAALAPPGMNGGCVALWPEPVDHDVCFARAGFTRFEDTDAAWDAAFDALVDRLLDALSRHGAPRIVAGEPPVRRAGMLRREAAGPRACLVAAATNDAFPPCRVAFGDPPRGQILTSDGHPILWVDGAGLAAQALIAAAAGPLGAVMTTLDWMILAPGPTAHVYLPD